MPSIAIRHAIVSVLLSICLAPIALAGYPDPGPPEMQADATLNDVMFINPQRGWAVGDRGVIWHTRDGGRHWELQASPAECRLESVFFLDAQNGWIVGGYTHPLTHKSSGIVLRTRDGGGRWEETRDASLPLLKKVKFFDARQGWAAGLSSSLYRSGIFTTRDGGRSWSPIPGDAPAGYLAALAALCAIGAVAAGFILGILQSFASLNEVKEIFPGIDQIILYLVAVVILLVRPRGLMGQKGVMET